MQMGPNETPPSAPPVTVDPRTGYFIGLVPASIGAALLDDSSGDADRTGDWRVVVRDGSSHVVAQAP